MNAAKPAEPQALIDRASGLIRLRRYAEAIVDCDRAIALKPDHGEAYAVRGNALRHLDRLEEALASCDQALAIDPRCHSAWYHRGKTLKDLKRPQEALSSYDRALAIEANSATWSGRGAALAALGRIQEALENTERAIALDARNIDAHRNRQLLQLHISRLILANTDRAIASQPGDVAAHSHRAIALMALDRLDESIASYDRMLALDPRQAEAHNLRGVALMDLGRLDEALASLDRAIAIRPDYVGAHCNKAAVKLAQGEYAEGWRLFDHRLRNADRLPPLRKRWDGGPLAGKRLLIRGELGLGDVLQFIRYAALCKERGASVLVACDAPLRRLLANCHYIDQVVTNPAEQDFDAQIEVMSLPRLFGTTLDTVPTAVPYLEVGEPARQKWAPRFAGAAGPRIGLVWAGEPRHQDFSANLMNARRSLRLAQLQPLLELEGPRYYSLQVGAMAGEIEELGWGHRLVDYTGEIEDYLDTAAIIANLDLVIAADTSVVHAAGALGKPVWVLSRFAPCWRWLDNRERNPWYPTARVFGQTRRGDWQSVVERLRTALIAHFRLTAGQQQN